MRYRLEIDKRNIEVYPIDWEGKYYVEWDGLRVGYVFSLTNADGKLIWIGSIQILNQYAKVIGDYIVACDGNVK